MTAWAGDMGKQLTPHRWFPAWRIPSPRPEFDAADVGTAFGLDMSLTEMADAPLQAPATARRAGWMSRLMSPMRKPTA